LEVRCHAVIVRRAPGRWQTGKGAAALESRRPRRYKCAFQNRRTRMKIVLAYSGGLDTSVLLKWIKQT